MMRSTTLLLALVAAATATSGAGAPAARLQVSELRPLLVQALEHGSAQGVLVGVGLDYIRRRFDSAAPIEIDVRTLHALPQAGCSRLEIVTQQRDVLEAGHRHEKSLKYQISFCRDGRFPESGR